MKGLLLASDRLLWAMEEERLEGVKACSVALGSAVMQLERKVGIRRLSPPVYINGAWKRVIECQEVLLKRRRMRSALYAAA